MNDENDVEFEAEENEYRTPPKIDTKTRHAFLVKSYLIFLPNMLFTVGLIALSIYTPSVGAFFKDKSWLLATTIVVSFLAMSVICFLVLLNRQAARLVPLNLFLLYLFTIFHAVFISIVSVALSTDFLLVGYATTAGIIVLNIVICLQTRVRYVDWYVFLVDAIFYLIAYGIFGFFTRQKRVVLVAMLFILFVSIMVSDSWKMMRGKYRRHGLVMPELIASATLIYIDSFGIVSLILHAAGPLPRVWMNRRDLSDDDD